MILKNLFYVLVIFLEKLLPKKNCLPILLYHQTPDSFEDQLKLLKKLGYQSLTEEEFNDFINHKTLPANRVLITFDDGLKDNYDQAYPLLKKYGFKAIFFVIGDQIGAEGRMSSEELKELDREGFIVANHLYSHRILPELNQEELKTEYFKVVEALEKVLGQKETNHWLAYPKGKINEQALGYLEKLEPKFGFVVGNKMAKNCHRLKIPRIEVYPNDSRLKFRARLSPYYYL